MSTLQQIHHYTSYFYRTFVNFGLKTSHLMDLLVHISLFNHIQLFILGSHNFADFRTTKFQFYSCYHPQRSMFHHVFLNFDFNTPHLTVLMVHRSLFIYIQNFFLHSPNSADSHTKIFKFYSYFALNVI